MRDYRSESTADVFDWKLSRVVALAILAFLVHGLAQGKPSSPEIHSIAGVHLGQDILVAQRKIAEYNPNFEIKAIVDRRGNITTLHAREVRRIGSKLRPIDEVLVLADARGVVIRAARSKARSPSSRQRDVEVIEGNG